MATISLCMIVKNEEDVLARCLRSAAPAVDEIIIVDTGSTDRTKEIARQFTDHIYDFVWVDDFSAARNFSFSKATMDYYFWLDADDVLDEANCRALQDLKQDLCCDVVMMQYRVGCITFYRERLLRRSAGWQWEGAVHEAITPRGKIQYSPITVTHQKEKVHDPRRNLRIYEKLLDEGGKWTPRDTFYYARELTYHGREQEAIAQFEAFLREEDGWLENQLEACRLLAGCYRKMGEEEKALDALFRSFSLDCPRAELCCDIGDLFLGKGRYPLAVYWYETALSCPRRDLGGFITPDRYGIYPALQLCLCYDRMGEEQQAFLWNERAAAFDPAHPSVAFNRNYFAEKNAHSAASS